MQKIPLGMVTVGMVIGDDLISEQGALLAHGQSTVDEAMLRRLFTAGVDEVVVMGKSVPGYDMGYDAKRMCKRLPQLFKYHAGDPFMSSVYAILMKHFKARI